MYNESYFNGTSEDIKILQSKLKELGFFNPVVNGKYDLATSIGVKAFQKYANIEETGIVNDETWKLLNSYTSKAVPIINTFPTLKIGDNNSYVADLKTKLKSLLYYTNDINTTFDLELENAVKRFQYNNDLTADGIVGSLTWNRLNSLYGNLNECAKESEDEFANTYTVKSGDTLYSIAKKFNTTVDDLKILNNLNSNILNVGMVLKIPSISDDNYTTYIVKSGDTLYSIANKYNTTVNDIKNLNNLTSNILSINQVLKIPTSSNLNYINYVVLNNDTLYSISKKYNVSIDTIKSLNNLYTDIIIPGQVLKIPISSNVNYIIYKVKNNDTLYSIANRYNTTVNDIKILNNLTNDFLKVGIELKIPV